MASRGMRRRTEALRELAAAADLPLEYVDDPELPHFRLQLRDPDYAALALQDRSWTLSAEGALPFETVDVAARRARPRAVAHGLVDAVIRIGVDAVTTDRRHAGESLVEVGFDLAIALGDARRAADAALVLGDSASARGDTPGAASWFEVALGEAERLHDPTLVEEARSKRLAATRRAIVELGRTPELGAELAQDRPEAPALPRHAPALEEAIPEGFAPLDVPRSIGLADLLTGALATPGIGAAEFDGGSGYWPGGVAAVTAAGIRAEVAVFSEFGYRVVVEGPGIERRTLPRILENDAPGDALVSALLGAIVDVELDVASGREVLSVSADPADADARGASAVARTLDGHVVVLGERASRRTPPALTPQERLRLGRYAAEFPGRPAGTAIAALLAELGGPGRLAR